MPCFYCGKKVSLVRQITDGDFCSDEHRKRYHDLTRLALDRLMGGEEQAVSGTTPRISPPPPPVAVVQPPRQAPRRRAKRPDPPVAGQVTLAPNGVHHGVPVPVPAQLVTAPTSLTLFPQLAFSRINPSLAQPFAPGLAPGFRESSRPATQIRGLIEFETRAPVNPSPDWNRALGAVRSPFAKPRMPPLAPASIEAQSAPRSEDFRSRPRIAVELHRKLRRFEPPMAAASRVPMRSLDTSRETRYPKSNGFGASAVLHPNLASPAQRELALGRRSLLAVSCGSEAEFAGSPAAPSEAAFQNGLLAIGRAPLPHQPLWWSGGAATFATPPEPAGPCPLPPLPAAAFPVHHLSSPVPGFRAVPEIASGPAPRPFTGRIRESRTTPVPFRAPADRAGMPQEAALQPSGQPSHLPGPAEPAKFEPRAPAAPQSKRRLNAPALQTGVRQALPAVQEFTTQPSFRPGEAPGPEQSRGSVLGAPEKVRKLGGPGVQAVTMRPVPASSDFGTPHPVLSHILEANLAQSFRPGGPASPESIRALSTPALRVISGQAILVTQAFTAPPPAVPSSTAGLAQGLAPAVFDGRFPAIWPAPLGAHAPFKELRGSAFAPSPSWPSQLSGSRRPGCNMAAVTALELGSLDAPAIPIAADSALEITSSTSAIGVALPLRFSGTEIRGTAGLYGLGVPGSSEIAARFASAPAASPVPQPLVPGILFRPAGRCIAKSALVGIEKPAAADRPTEPTAAVQESASIRGTTAVSSLPLTGKDAVFAPDPARPVSLLRPAAERTFSLAEPEPAPAIPVGTVLPYGIVLDGEELAPLEQPTVEEVETPVAPPDVSKAAAPTQRPVPEQRAREQQAGKQRPLEPAVPSTPQPSDSPVDLPAEGVEAREGLLGSLLGLWSRTSGTVKTAVLGLPVVVIAFSLIWTSETVRESLLNRAAVEQMEDFHSGASNWRGGSDWSRTPEGMRIGELALLRRSLNMKDYDLEFSAQIALGLRWVFRATDSQNHYVMRISVLKPGLVPQIALIRYAVIAGQEAQHVQVPIRERIGAAAPFTIHMKVEKDGFTTSLNGQLIDFWRDDRFAAGGIGFSAEPNDNARIQWVKLYRNTDFVGRLCAFFAPNN
jgi:hypothetical protein